MTGALWHWEDRDFGFRFRAGRGKGLAEYYQGRRPDEFYVVSPEHRKLDDDTFRRLLTSRHVAPPAPSVVPMPWRNYERHWDWIDTEDGIPLNYAGCFVWEEIHRREDEGVARALELVAQVVARPRPAPLTLSLLRDIHRALMGDIYPFAGEWRTVSLHKGSGATKWPIPPGGMDKVMLELEEKIFLRSPVLSDDDDDVYAYASEVMGEILAYHPFREGNGRTAFLVGNLLLMQNDFVPLDAWERRRDEVRYLAASEAARTTQDYQPLAKLIKEWEEAALQRWRANHGQEESDQP